MGLAVWEWSVHCGAYCSIILVYDSRWRTLKYWEGGLKYPPLFLHLEMCMRPPQAACFFIPSKAELKLHHLSMVTSTSDIPDLKVLI